MKIVVTGALGFVGRHVTDHFRVNGHEVAALDEADDDAAWESAFETVDAVIHLAGVNRPLDDAEFASVNVGVTEKVVAYCRKAGQAPRILMSSTVHAESSSPYGVSKRQAEDTLARYSAELGGEVVVYRFPNLFGKWSRPNYNSVVATWCYCISRGIPCEVSDPSTVITLLHIDDVVSTFESDLESLPRPGEVRYGAAGPCRALSLGELMGLLVSFGDVRRGSVLPDLSDRFVSRLFSTYISYLPQGMLAYELERRSDPRGVLAEFIKSPAVGQVFVSRTRPGISRGDHYHQTKVEKFLVLGGTAVIRLRNVKSGETDEYCVNGHDLVVVDIPPGWTHNIENIGNEDLIVLFWASEVFDPVLPDTFPERVLGWPVDGVATRDDET